ncbi:hypothetical protein CEP52_011309 [Fusarium oligoseptatum]|uniref:Uncharacterized protein n=1 Tax=Fusarium oligoseptatum TaxID=2604345 RepID=A0A428T3S2_9HYPO|nr:hypothetical protein CEP52_011309 [Fusarium oligoseptatum]
MARPFARRCAEASEQVLTGLQFNGPRTPEAPTCGWEQSRVGAESTEHWWAGSSTFAVEANIFDAVEGGAMTNGAHVVLVEDRPGLSIRPVSVI